MFLFYKSTFIQSVLSFFIIAWYSNFNTGDKNYLSHIVKVASEMSATEAPLTAIFN